MCGAVSRVESLSLEVAAGLMAAPLMGGVDEVRDSDTVDHCEQKHCAFWQILLSCPVVNSGWRSKVITF